MTGSILYALIQFQFSSSSSGHSFRNFAPPSPALIAPAPFEVEFGLSDACPLWVPPPVEFHHRERAAAHCRPSWVALMLPVVISSLVMNDSRPMRMVETSQAGLNDLG